MFQATDREEALAYFEEMLDKVYGIGSPYLSVNESMIVGKDSPVVVTINIQDVASTYEFMSTEVERLNDDFRQMHEVLKRPDRP